MAATKEQKRKYEQKREKRSRTWTFIVYPDSAPEGWQQRLDDEHLQWVESPLHDSDVNADGKPKKPHWHVMVLFSNVKTYAQAKEVADLVCGTVPQMVKDRRAMVRYFIHQDNPEKAQYSASELIEHGGADVVADLQSTSDRYTMIAEMMDFVDQSDTTEFYELLQYARTCRRGDWFPLLCDSCSYVMTQYIKSRHFAVENARMKKGGLPTGPKRK